MEKPAPKCYSYLIATIVIVALLAGGALAILGKLLHLDSYKDQLLAEMQQSLHRTVTYEKGSYSLGLGPALTFTKVAVRENGSSDNFITADKITFRIALLPLLKKRIVFREVVIENPVISILRDKNGLFNISDLLENKGEESSLHVKGIRIKKGDVRFQDFFDSPAGIHFNLRGTDLSLSQFVYGKRCDFRFSTTISGDGKNGSITLNGSAKLAEKGKLFTDTLVNSTVVIQNLDAEPFWPYYRRFVPFNKILGNIDLNSTFKGKLADFGSKGTFKVSGLRFDYPKVFHSILEPKNLQFHYDMALTPRDINLKSIDLTVDALKVKGECNILDIPSRDPHIKAHATTSNFRLEDFHQYIPYGIIAHDASTYIEQHIKGGVYKLDDGNLDGRASKIARMWEGENYNVLSVKGRVEKGLVTYGPDVPTFNSVKGELEMRGKDFFLHNMTANFGGSPFTLEGKITDYPLLDRPCNYPFTATFKPRQKELAWIIGKEYDKKFFFSGDSRLRLKGDGPSADYKLSGDWSLDSATYSYPDMINKPSGKPNNLSFKGSINDQEAKLTSLKYELTSMHLSVDAVKHFSGKSWISMNIKSNPFQITEVSPMIFPLTKYKPAGIVQIALKGDSRTGKYSDIGWSGNITFKGFSLKPSEKINSVSNVNGSVAFSGSSIEKSTLSGKLGNSTYFKDFKGNLSGFTNPSFSLEFSAPSLDMSDLGLNYPGKNVIATGVTGNLTLKDREMQIKSLIGKIGNSKVTIKGVVQDINSSKPKVDIDIESPNLDLDDLIHVMKMETPGKKELLQGVEINATITAEKGIFKEISFEDLSTTAIFENRILYLQEMEMSVFGGSFTGNCRLDMGGRDTPPRYQVSYQMENISVDRFAQALGVRSEQITGKMSINGDLTAKGNNSPELRKTSLGSIKLNCKKGSLKKFPVLSKIFSLLNVSQLLKFQLPDMVSGGMPYNNISATFAIQDGIASSKDFYIASDAMNISAVGKIDLVREEVDATFGAQPLQTVERIVNRLPVVGWILSGGKKTFLTTYFEAKGKLDDPSVKAIPAKSIAKGVFNIFIRVFQLPAKLITDTGEVLIGK